MVCPCKYPLLVIREGITFVSLPLDEFTENDLIYLPLIYKKTIDEGEDKGDWVVVQWKDEMHDRVKRYVVAGHVVMAGCEESELECDSKNVYMVMHPAEDWKSNHVIDVHTT